MLYSIALEVSPSQKEAEEILINTFQKVYHQELPTFNYPFFCAKLIRLLLQTAHEQLHIPHQSKNNFQLKRFKNTPLLHQLLCEQINLELYCEENNLTRSEAAKMLRKEFTYLRASKK